MNESNKSVQGQSFLFTLDSPRFLRSFLSSSANRNSRQGSSDRASIPIQGCEIKPDKIEDWRCVSLLGFERFSFCLRQGHCFDEVPFIETSMGRAIVGWHSR